MIVCDDWLSKQENFKAFMNTFLRWRPTSGTMSSRIPRISVWRKAQSLPNRKTLTASSAFGGGSSLDSAKAINTLLHSDFPINQYFAELGPDAKVPISVYL